MLFQLPTFVQQNWFAGSKALKLLQKLKDIYDPI
jgi:hypothetical protein